VSDAPREEDDGATGAPRPTQEMRLRSGRAPVTRLSRKVLLGLGTAAALGVGGALFIALKPQQQTTGSELYNTNNRNTPDGLATLPKDYTGLPKNPPQLGPPLPGDLGRPILNAGAPAPGMPTPSTAEDPEKQRLTQELEAARTSHLFATTNVGLQAPAPVTATPAAQAPPGSANPISQDHRVAFMNGPVDRETVSPDRIAKPASPYVVQAGWVIAGALITGIKSDIPGDITAQVTENVYDSPTGRYLLIPQGSRLFGKYDSQISFGQTRVQVVWTRITFPDGDSIVLQRLPGADPEGYAGLEDEVDNHWGALFEAAVLSTILSVGSEAGISDSENNLAQAIRQGASQSFSQTGQQVVARSLNVQPTLTDRPGLPVRIIVDRDLVLEPYRG
jgi:type IV secretory pathway VirB10-like protein